MRYELLASAGALALAAAFPALAAEPAGAQPPPAPHMAPSPLVVVGRRTGSLTQPAVDQQRSEVLQTAGSVGFVRAEDFQQRFASDLRDVLKDTPGVFVQERYGKELRLSVRGSGLSRGYHLRGIELLQDGVPFNMADGSGDFYEIDPLALRSVEIYKGGNGLAYGSSVLGGAIDAVTATARTATAANTLRVDGGSFDTVRGSGQLSYASGPLDGLAVLTASHAAGYREHDRHNDVFFNGNVGMRLGDAAENRLYATVVDSRQQLPGSLTLDDALNHPRIAGAVLAGDQARNQTVQRLADRLSIALPDNGQLEVDAWIYHKHLDHPIFQVLRQDGMTWGAQARYTGDLTLGGIADQLIVGARAYGGLNNAAQYVNVAGRPGAQTSDADQKAINLEAFAENRLHLTSSLTLSLGAKALSARRELVNFTNPQAGDERTYVGVNPRVGVLWQAAPEVQVFADLTRSRDVPDFTDLAQTQPSGATGFVALDAQRAWTGEFGARGRSGRVAWDITVYRAEIRGELVQFSVASDIPATTFNADRTVHQGVEAWASYDLVGNLAGASSGDRLTLVGLWNLNDFRFRHDAQYGDNHLAGEPQNLFRAEIRYARPQLAGLRDIYLTPQLDWVPTGAWADQANTLRAPGYALVGLEAGFSLPNRVQLFFEARNLGDKAYISDISTARDATAVTTAIFYPGDGRSFYAGLRLKF